MVSMLSINIYIKAMPIITGKNFTLSGAEICFNKHSISVYREARNLVENDPKRFMITDDPQEIMYKDQDIPAKALRSLPTKGFVYKPQSLHYFVNIWDKVVLEEHTINIIHKDLL